LDRKSVVAGALLAILVVFSSFSAGMFYGRYNEHKRAEKYAQELPSVRKVQEVQEIIDQAYVEEVSDKALINGAVKGMIEALDDPYTHYLDASCFSAFKEEASGEFEGVGIVISSKNNEIVVVSPIEGTPAEKAGIKANDVIAKINDKETKGMTTDDAVKLIKGKSGTKVTLTMRREGEKKPLAFELVRTKIHIPNVSSRKIDGQIGYLRLNQFNEQTSDDLSKAYDKLKSEGAKGVILDLRNNPGGILDEAVELGSMWVKSGAIVKIKNRDGDIESRDASGNADTETQLVVLVNKGSASASEILAGALQDYKRAVIVGETTFGKASVQTVINLSDGTGILLTTDKYLTPKERMIHKKGIKPDVVVKVDEKDKEDIQLNKATEIMKELLSGKRQLKAAS